MLEPASYTTVLRFFITCRVCSSIPPSTICPVSGFRGICPEMKATPLNTLPTLYGPMALGPFSVLTVLIPVDSIICVANLNITWDKTNQKYQSGVTNRIFRSSSIEGLSFGSHTKQLTKKSLHSELKLSGIFGHLSSSRMLTNELAFIYYFLI